MNIFEFLSVIPRKKYTFLLAWILSFGVLMGGFSLLPSFEKATIYFSVKPVSIQSEAMISDGSEKLAETISGWAKDPAFQQKILENSDIYIPSFKKKISARKQNRFNVFWTLKFSDNEKQHLSSVAESTVATIQNAIAEYNTDSNFQLKITPPRIFIEPYKLPFSWVLSGVIIISFFLGILYLYFSEAFTDKISFPKQIKEILPDSPLLEIPEKIGVHDERLLEQFILTFDSPRLVGTFPKAEKFFSLAPKDSINEDRDTPILLVQLGTTKMTEIRNLVAIFGDEIGVIIFSR